MAAVTRTRAGDVAGDDGEEVAHMLRALAVTVSQLLFQKEGYVEEVM